MNEIKNTIDWHAAVYRAKVEQFGEPPLSRRIELAMNLIQEETGELLAELRKVQDAPERELLAAIGKEASDVLFVVLQAVFALGIPFEAVYQEVLASNWSKLVNGPVFREDGKLLKSEHYRPADIERVLREQ